MKDMKAIPLTQDELKVIVGTLQRIQVSVTDARAFLTLIDKLVPFIDPLKPEDIKVEKPPLVESEVV